ncbi:MAG TPA: response regulator [bacterium]|nr:response regulator [bacterium]HPN30915.1 response regulator [bacterium]
MNIFILDDEIDIVELMKDVLKLENHNVRGFIRFEDMINNLTGDIDLVISDINMPDINGYEAAEKIGKILGNCPPKTLLMSASSVNRTEYSEFGNSILGVICKPFDLEKFLELINKFESLIKRSDDEVGEIYFNEFQFEISHFG